MKPLKFLCHVPLPLGTGMQWVAIVIAENTAHHHLDTYFTLALEIQRHFHGSSMVNIWCGEVPKGNSHEGYAMCQYYITDRMRPAAGDGWTLREGWPF